MIFDDISCGIHQGDKIWDSSASMVQEKQYLPSDPCRHLDEADEGQVDQRRTRLSHTSSIRKAPAVPVRAQRSFPIFGVDAGAEGTELESAGQRAHMVLNKLGGFEDHEEEIELSLGGSEKSVWRLAGSSC